MSSVRLHSDQVARLKKIPAGPRVIHYAVKRWKRGDFVIESAKIRRDGKNQLQLYPIWEKPSGVNDSQIRDILDAHFATPDRRIEAEMMRLDAVIAHELAMIEAKGPCIFEDQE